MTYYTQATRLHANGVTHSEAREWLENRLRDLGIYVAVTRARIVAEFDRGWSDAMAAESQGGE